MLNLLIAHWNLKDFLKLKPTCFNGFTHSDEKISKKLPKHFKKCCFLFFLHPTNIIVLRMLISNISKIYYCVKVIFASFFFLSCKYSSQIFLIYFWRVYNKLLGVNKTLCKMFFYFIKIQGINLRYWKKFKW